MRPCQVDFAGQDFLLPVGRAINRLKQSRAAVATRYGKRGYVFLGTAAAAAVAIWLRT